jgi:hypothetical protein
MLNEADEMCGLFVEVRGEKGSSSRSSQAKREPKAKTKDAKWGPYKGDNMRLEKKKDRKMPAGHKKPGPPRKKLASAR